MARRTRLAGRKQTPAPLIQVRRQQRTARTDRGRVNHPTKLRHQATYGNPGHQTNSVDFLQALTGFWSITLYEDCMRLRTFLAVRYISRKSIVSFHMRQRDQWLIRLSPGLAIPPVFEKSGRPPRQHGISLDYIVHKANRAPKKRTIVIAPFFTEDAISFIARWASTSYKG